MRTWKKKRTKASQLIKDFHKQKPFLQKLIEFWSPHKVKRKRKVNETPMRSFLKTMGFRVVEVLVDTLLLEFINPVVQENLIIAITIELICWLLSFVWERLWNKIDYGREVVAKCPHCNKETTQ